MKFERIIKTNGNFLHVPLEAKSSQEIDLQPGDLVASYSEDGSPYGVFGTVYATQIDLNKQIEYNLNKQIEYKKWITLKNFSVS